MTIQIELSPEEMQRLTREANARGIPAENYAQTLLRIALSSTSGPDGHLSVAEARKMLAEMAEGSDKLPVLPASAFSRESFYEGDTDF